MASKPTFVSLSSAQLDIFESINTALGSTNQLLQEQHITVASIARLGGMKDAQIKKIRKIWEAEMSAMGGSIGTTFHGVREDATYTSGYIRGQSLGSSKSVTGILGDLKKARIASVDFADEVGKAAQETEFVYKNAAKIFGFLGDDTKSSMGKVNTQAGQYMGTLEGLGKQLQFTDDQYKINGLSLEVFAGKGGKGLRKLGESYTYLANKTTLAYHATRDLGERRCH